MDSFKFRIGEMKKISKVSDLIRERFLRDRDVYEYGGVSSLEFERVIDVDDLPEGVYDRLVVGMYNLVSSGMLSDGTMDQIVLVETVNFYNDGVCEYVFDGYRVYVGHQYFMFGENSEDRLRDRLDEARDEFDRRFAGFDELDH